MTPAALPAMSEADLQRLIVDTCKVYRLRLMHPYDSRRTTPGWPDLAIVGPGGALFRELKAAAGRVTVEQREWLAAMGAAGLDADVWRPIDWTSGRIVAELRVLRHGRCG